MYTKLLCATRVTTSSIAVTSYSDPAESLPRPELSFHTFHFTKDAAAVRKEKHAKS